jgi:pimeloyl-ACP methyl ester carboxylesterase
LSGKGGKTGTRYPLKGLRTVEVHPVPRPTLYWKSRLPILFFISAILCIKGSVGPSTIPALFAAGLIVLAVVGHRVATCRGQTSLPATFVLFVDVCAAMIVAILHGLFSATGIAFAALLVLSLGGLQTWRLAAACAGAWCLIGVAAGVLFRSGGTGLEAALPVIAVTASGGAMALVSAWRLRRLGLAVDRMRADLDKALVEKETGRDSIVRLYEASQATSQEVEPGGIMDMLAEDATRLIGCSSASVAIFIEKDLLASVTKGISNEFKRNLRWRVRKGGMTEWVLTTGKPLVINDALNDPRSCESSAVKIGGQRSIMAVPLAAEDEVFGIVYVGDKHNMRFD